jgi:hypothetical protein
MSEAEQAGRRRHSLNTRTTQRLRERLEQSAQASGRSLAQEVEVRLEKSFETEDILLRTFGTPHNMLILRAVASCLSAVQIFTGKRWSEDFESLRQCQIAVEHILFTIWGGSRRDRPRKSAEYLKKVEALGIPEGVEIGAIAARDALSEIGLTFPREHNAEPDAPPAGIQLKINPMTDKI